MRRPGRSAWVWVVLAAYAALTLFVALRHEPWRDEADSWLMVRDADLAGVLSRMPYAGTPALWYLLLFPLPRLGLPILSQNVLHVALAVGAVALLLWRAPFPPLTKVLFAFSYFMAFEYAIVARSYVLSLLCLFGAAALYRWRFERPALYAIPVASLCNANAHSLGLGAVITLGHAVEMVSARRVSLRTLSGLALMALGALLSAVQLRTPPDGNVAGFEIVPEAVARSAAGAFMPTFEGPGPAAVGLLAIAAIGVTLARHRIASLIYWVGVGWLWFVYVFKYSGTTRHYGLLLVFALFCLWIRFDEQRENPLRPVVATGSGRLARLVGYAPIVAFALLHGSLFFAALIGGRQLYLDSLYAFSGAPEAAAFLGRSELAGRPIAAHRPSHGEAVLPYLPGVRLWYLGLERYGTYMPWDASYRVADEMDYVEAVERLPAELAQRRDLLLLVSERPLPEPQAARYRLLYSTQGRVFYRTDEVYFVYEPKA